MAPPPALRERPEREPEAEDQAPGGPAGAGRSQGQAGEDGPGEGAPRRPGACGEGGCLRDGVSASQTLADFGFHRHQTERFGEPRLAV